ncbi:MAG: hypothetical protein ACTTKZ_01230 [Bacteroides sp.]
MRLKENLYFLALLGGFGISFAQAQTLGPADGDAAYKSPTGDQMERVDKGTHITNNTIYQTVGKTMPYYVAPSLLNFPTLDRNKIKYTTAELTSVPPITWTWSTASTNITVSGAANLNKADITVNAQEAGATIEVAESSSCGAAAKSSFKLVGTAVPSLYIKDAELAGVASVEQTFDGSADIPAIFQNSKGRKLSTCDASNINGKKIKLKLVSKEDPLEKTEPNFRKYSFSIMMQEYHKNGTTYTPGTATTPKTYTITTKTYVSGDENAPTEIEIDLPTTVTLNAGDEYVDLYLYLGGAEGRNGVVSVISQYSDNGGALTDNPYKKDEGFFAMVRLTSPKTGPIYFIPYQF